MCKRIVKVLLLVLLVILACGQPLRASDAQEPPEEEKNWQRFELTWEKPDGKADYYITKPQITIRHLDEEGTTHYVIQNALGEVVEGELNSDNAEVSITKKFISEGHNRLKVYMTDDEGVMIEDEKDPKAYAQTLSFDVDTKPPMVELKTAGGFEIFHKDAAAVWAAAKDETSKLSYIRWYVNGKMVKEVNLSKESAEQSLQISEASAGSQKIPMWIEAGDRAGNVTVVSRGLLIDKQLPVLSLAGAYPYEITSRNVELTIRAKDENRLKRYEVQIFREDQNGNRIEQKPGSWQEYEGNYTSVTTLDKDGLYIVKALAEDQVGHSAASEMRLIVDKQNPVIRHVEDLNYTYVQQFSWDYPEQETIEDFTAYSYEMRLNGKLYHPGQIVHQEGRQLFSITAKDAAGNTAEARAEFVIDHTAPQVVFENITEGALYEEPVTGIIRLDGQRDWLKQVLINGQVQPIQNEAGSFTYTFAEAREYKVEVIALDYAGNTTSKGLSFEVKEPDTILEKMTRPVKEALGITQQSSKKQSDQDEGTNTNYSSYILAGIVLIILLSAAAAVLWTRIKRKEIV